MNRRVGKGASAPCPSSIGEFADNGGHASLCPPYGGVVARMSAAISGKLFPHVAALMRATRASPTHTGSAIEYFTWLSAKLDSIDAMPSSRVSLVFWNAS